MCKLLWNVRHASKYPIEIIAWSISMFPNLRVITPKEVKSDFLRDKDKYKIIVQSLNHFCKI